MSAPVAMARSLIDQFGSPMGDGALVRVDASCRRIARTTSRSPGTVGNYLRRLDHLGVRVCTQPLVFDEERLRQIEQGANTPTKPLRHLHPVTDLEEPMLPPAVEGTSPGRGTASDNTAFGIAVEALVQISELIAAHPESADALCHVADAVTRLTELTGTRWSARDPIARATTARSRGGVEGSRDPETRATPSSLEKKGSKEDVDKPSYLPGTSPRDPARQPKGRARDGEDVLALVSPLRDAADRYGLGGITSVDGLLDALSPYSDAEVNYAVTQLVRETERQAAVGVGTPLRNPFGKLAARAAARDPIYFPAKPPSTTVTGLPDKPTAHVVARLPALADPEQTPAQAAARAAVAALTPGEVAELDCRLLAGELPGVRPNVVARFVELGNEAALSGLRTELWARSQRDMPGYRQA